MIKLNNLYNLSCEEGISRLKEQNIKIDCLITSPPYNVNLGKNKYNKNPYDLYRDNKKHSEYIGWLKNIFQECQHIMNIGGSVCVNIGDGKNGCYDDKTEVLTQRGWLFFKDIDTNDLVLTLNPETHSIEWSHPYDCQCYDYEGDLYHYKTYTLDLRVTPNHRLYYENHHTKGWKIDEARNCSQRQFYLPRAFGNWNSDSVANIVLPAIYVKNKKNKIIPEKHLDMNLFLELAGWYISEGCLSCDTKNHHTITISQCPSANPENCKLITDCLTKLGYNYNISGTNITIADKQLCSFLSEQFGKYHQNKQISRLFLDLPVEQLVLLWNSLIKGDGCLHCNGQLRYFTSSHKLADNVEEIALKLGYSTRTNIRHRKPHYSKKLKRIITPKLPSIELTFNKKKTFWIDSKKSLKKENYKGKVYCCSTTNGIIYSRRNGCSVWCGNSIPTHSDILQFMTKELNYILISTIIWEKSQIGNRTSWGCYDDQTKVVTVDGIKYFKDVNINNDTFVTLNTKTKEIEYQKAFDYINYWYEGNMYKVKNRNIELLVTPNHTMVTTNKNGTIELKEIQKIKHNITIPQGCKPTDRGIDTKVFILPKIIYKKHSKRDLESKDIPINMDLWLQFLGIYLTDGNNDKYNVTIYQFKDTFKQEIIEMLNKLPFTFKYRSNKGEYRTRSLQLATYLKQFGNKNKRTIPIFIYNLSNRQKEIFIEWLFKGDGSFYKDNKKRYITISSIEFLNDFIQLLIQLNYKFSIEKQFNPEPRLLNGRIIKQNYPLYKVYIKHSNNYWIDKRYKGITTTHYDGNVYCVSVPNKTLLIERKGKFTWCGNSWLSPSCPSFPTPFEYILIFRYKEKKHKGNKEDITVTKEEFIRNSLAIWKFAPEQQMKVIGHPAMFPQELPKRLIQQLTYKNDIVLDIFSGAGTTALVAKKLNRRFIGFELSKDYHNIAINRLENK